MPRYRFDLGLKPFLKRPAREGGDAAPASEFSTGPGAPWRARLRRNAVRVIGPFARRARRFLVGELSYSVDSLAAKTDLQVVALHHKIDELHVKMKRVEERQARDLAQIMARFDLLTLIGRSAVPVDDNTVAIRTVDGYVLVPKTDTHLLLLLLDAGLGGLEPGTRQAILAKLPEDGTFVDVGAHIGLLTLAAARHVGPRGRVFAFEPTPLTFKQLEQAIAINGLSDRVRIENAAVGAAAGRARFNVGSVLGHSSLYDLPGEESQAIDVDVVTLDERIPPGTHVDMVKIDVEGAELDVLKGMTRVLDENRSIILIAEFGPSHLRRIGQTAREWFGAFSALGFEPFVINEETGELKRLDVENAPTGNSTNILFTRKQTRA